MVTFKLETFEGPLDLLLHLIQKNKVSIYDIPIVLITEQYLEYIEKMKTFDMEPATEFILMAAQLIYIKSKMLLPRDEDEEADPREELVDRLLEYQKYKNIAENLKEKQQSDYTSFVKQPENLKFSPEFNELDIDIKVLIDTFSDIMERWQNKNRPRKEELEFLIKPETVTVKSRIMYLYGLFKNKDKILFSEIFEGINKKEAVATFLAVLELISESKMSFIIKGKKIICSLPGDESEYKGKGNN